MKKNLYRATLIITVLLLILSSCSTKNNAVEGDRYDGSDIILDENGSIPETEAAGSVLGNSSSTSEAPARDGRKIIETLNLTVQTKEFDKLLDDLNAQISTLGGYIESSNISGRESESTRNRSATFNIRIPCESTNDFTSFISDNSVVINESVSTKDVTLSYVDMESRVSALESEKAALEKLLDSASTMSDIVAVRDKLTDVIYEIESYKSKLRTYDNLIEYSTVNVHIYEVERTAIVEEQTVFQKIGNNLKNNFENVWVGLVNIFIFIISAIPYLIPIAVIVIASVAVIRFKIKKTKAKKETVNKDINE